MRKAYFSKEERKVMADTLRTLRSFRRLKQAERKVRGSDK